MTRLDQVRLAAGELEAVADRLREATAADIGVPPVLIGALVVVEWTAKGLRDFLRTWKP